jgi:hypothetical protein
LAKTGRVSGGALKFARICRYWDLAEDLLQMETALE